MVLIHTEAIINSIKDSSNDPAYSKNAVKKKTAFCDTKRALEISAHPSIKIITQSRNIETEIG